ncbi:MAG: hypothetical protein GY936_05955 [Ignavibacteriae bacterium]|nr:hypothetical protein [Ignavibacteriota bacterium]
MNQKHFLISMLIVFFLSTVIVFPSTVTKTSIKTSVALITPNDDDSYYAYPSGAHNVGSQMVGLDYEKARTSYQFDISDIPPNSIISSVSLSYNFSGYYSSDYECEITFADDKSSPQDQYWEVSSAAVVLSLDDYISGSTSNISALKNDLIANLGANYYYLGAYSPDENTNNSDAILDISLIITYTPRVEITAKNIFNGGNIKVDGTTGNSPYCPGSV